MLRTRRSTRAPLPRLLLSLSLSVTLLAGCQSGLTPRLTTVSKPMTTAARVPGAASASVLAQANGQLVGAVRCPATILSDNGLGIIGNNGGGIISDNGLGVISNNGGSYHLLGTAAEVPLKNVTVALLDAQGHAVTGPDGKPLTAVTDAAGNYTFKGIVPGNNLVVAVVLPGNKGTLRAIAPRSGADVRRTDLSLVSSLTTGYILDQYVLGQAEPQKTLDKLPANVEADTRAKAAAAFATSGMAVPDSLTDAAAVAAVARLRTQDGPLDAQLQVVKRLLIPAGQFDFGNGQPGTEVSLDTVSGLLVAPDGTPYISCGIDRRLWRLDAQGRLQTAAGRGNVTADNPHGQSGPDAALAMFLAVGMDAKGRALILEEPLSEDQRALPNAARLTRLEPDGRLTTLWERAEQAVAVAPGPGDDVYVFTRAEANGGQTLTLYRVTAGQPPQPLRSFTPDEAAFFKGGQAVGCGRDGAIFVLTSVTDAAGQSHQVLERLADPQGSFTQAFEVPAGASAVLDANGNVFWLDPTSRALRLRKPDGTQSSPSQAVPAGDALSAAALAPDGTVYVAIDARVYQLAPTKATLLVGTDRAPGKATELSVAPTGLALGADGAFYMSDEKGNRVLRIGPDQQVTPYAGTGATVRPDGGNGDGGAALQAVLDGPWALHADARGNLYVSDTEAVRRIDAQGRIGTAYAFPGGTNDGLLDFAVGPDGTLFIGMAIEGGARLLKLAPGGQPVEIDREMNKDADFILATDATGALYAAAIAPTGGKLIRWTAALGVSVLKEDPHFAPEAIPYGGLAIDGRGRVYVGSLHTQTVTRFEMATGVFTPIAGPGTSLFSGAAVDDSLDQPGFFLFDREGNMLVCDIGHRQIKRIPASRL